jgi:hypothetical protein
MKLNKKIVFKSSYFYHKMMVEMYCIVHDLKLSPQLRDTFIFFCIFGINPETYKRLLHNKIAASYNVIYHYKSRLAGLGLVKKFKSGKWQVLEEFQNSKLSQFNIDLEHGPESKS